MLHLPIYNPQFESYIREFRKLLHTKGYKGAYYIAGRLQEFLFFMETQRINDIKEIKATHVIAYYEYLNERPNQRREGALSNSSIKSHLFALRLFFDYLLDTGIIASSPAHLPKFTTTTTHQRNIASVEEIKQIYHHTKTKFDKALLGLAYGCGLRRSEIVKLNTEDIDFQKGMLTVRKGKNGKTRTIPLSNNVMKDLKDYLVTERKELLQHLAPMIIPPSFLINIIGNRPLGKSLNDRLAYLIRQTENQSLIKKNITLHCLRHSISTHLIDSGADIEFVQKFLGHTLLDTTHIYSKRRKQKQKLLEALHREQQLKNNQHDL